MLFYVLSFNFFMEHFCKFKFITEKKNTGLFNIFNIDGLKQEIYYSSNDINKKKK